MGRRIKDLERLYEIHQGNGSNQYEQKPKNSVIAKSQSDLAAQMGISVDTLQNYKMLADMIPELDELVTTRIVTKSTISVLAKLATTHFHSRKLHHEIIRCVQMDTAKNTPKERDYSTNTRQQVAKMSGVGAGTVARYD